MFPNSGLDEQLLFQGEGLFQFRAGFHFLSFLRPAVSGHHHHHHRPHHHHHDHLLYDSMLVSVEELNELIEWGVVGRPSTIPTAPTWSNLWEAHMGALWGGPLLNGRPKKIQKENFRFLSSSAHASLSL